MAQQHASELLRSIARALSALAGTGANGRPLLSESDVRLVSLSAPGVSGRRRLQAARGASNGTEAVLAALAPTGALPALSSALQSGLASSPAAVLDAFAQGAGVLSSSLTLLPVAVTVELGALSTQDAASLASSSGGVSDSTKVVIGAAVGVSAILVGAAIAAIVARSRHKAALVQGLVAKRRKEHPATTADGNGSGKAEGDPPSNSVIENPMHRAGGRFKVKAPSSRLLMQAPLAHSLNELACLQSDGVAAEKEAGRAKGGFSVAPTSINEVASRGSMRSKEAGTSKIETNDDLGDEDEDDEGAAPVFETAASGLEVGSGVGGLAAPVLAAAELLPPAAALSSASAPAPAAAPALASAEEEDMPETRDEPALVSAQLSECAVETTNEGTRAVTRDNTSTPATALPAELVPDAVNALVDAARPWTLRHEAGRPVWRHSISGTSQAHVPRDVLEAEAAQGLREEAEARARAAAWNVHATEAGEAYYEFAAEGAEPSTTWIKPRELRKLHALEAANASRALRAEAGNFAPSEDDPPAYTNLRTGEVSKDVPACVCRLARADAAEAARLDREAAADWIAVAATEPGGAPTYEFLPDGSTSSNKPAVLVRVEELDADEAKRRRALAAGWAEVEDMATGELLWFHEATGSTQWEAPTAKDIREADARACVDPSERKAGSAAPRPPKVHATATEREAAGRRLLTAGAAQQRKSGYAAEAARNSAGAVAAFEADLRAVGLHSSQLAVFVDCSAANAQAGRRSFGGRGLHDVEGAARGLGLNPYEEALSDIAPPLESFDEDGLIPLFGFAAAGKAEAGGGGAAAGAVFAIAPAGGADGGGAPCSGLGEVLAAYRARVPRVAPGEVRSLVPVVRKAVELVAAADAEGAPRELLIALIITAGDSAARIALNSALVDASSYPIAFVIVGVGDGPFDGYAALDDEKGQRKFDNVTFVELEKIKAKCSAARAPLGAGLALAALAELPQVYADCKRAGLFRAAGARATHKEARPPAGHAAAQTQTQLPGSFSFARNAAAAAARL